MIVQQVQITIASVILVIAVLICGVATWSLTSLGYKNKIAQIEQSHAETVVKYERDIGAIQAQAKQENDNVLARMKTAQDALAELDREKTQELLNAQAKNDNLMRDVNDGTRRVHILQTSLADCGNTSGTGGNTSAGGMGDAAAIELTATAGSTILNIRKGITEDQAKLNYLQLYVKDIVKQCKKI